MKRKTAIAATLVCGLCIGLVCATQLAFAADLPLCMGRGMNCRLACLWIFQNELRQITPAFTHAAPPACQSSYDRIPLQEPCGDVYSAGWWGCPNYIGPDARNGTSTNCVPTQVNP